MKHQPKQSLQKITRSSLLTRLGNPRLNLQDNHIEIVFDSARSERPSLKQSLRFLIQQIPKPSRLKPPRKVTFCFVLRNKKPPKNTPPGGEVKNQRDFTTEIGPKTSLKNKLYFITLASAQNHQKTCFFALKAFSTLFGTTSFLRAPVFHHFDEMSPHENLYQGLQTNVFWKPSNTQKSQSTAPQAESLG